MEGSLDQKISITLEKAADALSEAEVLLSKGLLTGTVSRSYYAVFHSACAILLTKNLEFSKHSAVISSFGREFVKADIIDSKFHKILIDSFEARQLAEYDIFNKITTQFAEKIFSEAMDFVQMARDYCSTA